MKLLNSIVLILCVIMLMVTNAIPKEASKRDTRARRNMDYPDIPRASAWEAYVKFKSGKAIIIQAGGEGYRNRHVMGAIDLHVTDVDNKKKRLPNLPKTGKEIFIYCY